MSRTWGASCSQTWKGVTPAISQNIYCLTHPCYISKYLFSHPCYVSKCVYTNPRGSPHLGERLLDLVHVKPLTDHLALESTFCSIFLDLCLNLLVDSFHREGLTGCGGRFASRTLAAEKKRVHLIQQKRKSYLVTKVPSIISKADNSWHARHVQSFSSIMISRFSCFFQLLTVISILFLSSSKIRVLFNWMEKWPLRICSLVKSVFIWFLRKKSTFFSLFLLSSFISLSSLLNMSLISSLSSGKMDKWTIGNEVSDNWTIGQVTNNKILTNYNLQCESAKVSIQNSIVTNKNPK